MEIPWTCGLLNQSSSKEQIGVSICIYRADYNKRSSNHFSVLIVEVSHSPDFNFIGNYQSYNKTNAPEFKKNSSKTNSKLV